jgi:birA, biotin-[acetyl-CoA-carboxylase] ligase region
MDTKSRILGLLENSRDAYLSGEEIADALQISRGGVWKAIQELKKSGHKITAVTNKGYRIAADSDIVSAQGIESHLRGGISVGKIHTYASLESTNKTAKEMAIAEAPHGTVVTAETQTAGRGRYNREFFSPPEGGLYMSFVLRPDFLRFENVTAVTALAAVAVCEAIEAGSSLSPKIKWVNDIYIGGKKVCGILTEAVTDFESGCPHWIVLGIGVNVNTPAALFPDEIRETATSLNPSGGAPVSRNRLAAEIIDRVLGEDYPSELEIFGKYKSRLIGLGERVAVLRSGAELSYEATAVDIDSRGRLVVRMDSGEVRLVSSGEVRLVR